MRLSSKFSTVRYVSSDDFDRDPELEEEFRSRDWPDVTKPSLGESLVWKFHDMGWTSSVGGRESGPTWTARATPVAAYKIWVQRELHEDWRGDYYTYSFNPVVVLTTQKNKRSKTETRTEPVGYAETLAEAQEQCEKHAKDHFL